MSGGDRGGAPITLVTQRPPSASAQDEDIYLTVSVAPPTLDQQETIDIFLSIDFARRMIAELNEAVGVAMRNAARPL